MKKRLAIELVKAVARYKDHPNTQHIEVHAVLDSPIAQGSLLSRQSWSVLVLPRGDRYSEVPTRLPLTGHPCSCTQRWCASGKVAPGLLEIVRNGGRGDAP